MAKLSAADTEKALRRSNGNGLSPIEPKAPSDATKNGAGDPRLARIRDASPQGFRCSTRNDFEMVRISSEDDEIGTCFGLIRQSSDQPTKGALQIDQTNADFNSHDSTQGNTLNLVRPDSASLRKSEAAPGIGGFSWEGAVTHCIPNSYTRNTPKIALDRV